MSKCNMTAAAKVHLEGHVFNRWKWCKEQFGFANSTDSEFAALLLQRRLVSISYCFHVKTGQIKFIAPLYYYLLSLKLNFSTVS